MLNKYIFYMYKLCFISNSLEHLIQNWWGKFETYENCKKWKKVAGLCSDQELKSPRAVAYSNASNVAETY